MQLNPTAERWQALVTNKMYVVNLAMKGSTTLKFNMFVQGKEMANDASNLPVSVSNTVVVPTNDLTVVAGESFKVDIELRTTNAQLRANTWVPLSMIVCEFSDEKIEYTVAKGSARGKYVITFKAKQSTVTANVMSIKIKNELYTGVVPKINVVAASIATVQSCSSQGVPQPISDMSVDDMVNLYFLAKDEFGNKVLLNNDLPLKISVSGAD